MQKTDPRDFTLIKSITDVMFDEGISEKQKEAKIEALRQVRGLTEQYAKWGIREDLIDTVMKKKADLILAANTLADIRKAALPPKPSFNGVSWYEDPLSVPEEELILWSHMTLENRPTEVAFKRYMQLFERIFGISEEDILTGNLSARLREVE